MPIRTDLNTQELRAQFQAQRQSNQKRPASENAGAAKETTARVQSSVKLEATIRASGASESDSVDITLSGSLTLEAANGILEDSVIEEINKAFKEAGVDLAAEGSRGESTTPEATASRIVDFATGFLEAFEANNQSDAAEARIEGFMNVIREAISEGFQHAREFLEGIKKLSETVDENITKTFEVTNTLLDRFHQAQLDNLAASEAESEDIAEAKPVLPAPTVETDE